MFESQLVREWTAEARRQGRLAAHREYLLLTLEVRFSTPVPTEVVDRINRQESAEVLLDWFRTAIHTQSWEEFLAVLRR
jgi:hypothetical protein